MILFPDVLFFFFAPFDKCVNQESVKFGDRPFIQVRQFWAFDQKLASELVNHARSSISSHIQALQIGDLGPKLNESLRLLNLVILDVYRGKFGQKVQLGAIFDRLDLIVRQIELLQVYQAIQAFYHFEFVGREVQDAESG